MQVVLFETAKRLKESGFPQPSEIDPANRWLMFYVEPSKEGGAPELYSADRIDDIRSFSDPCEVVAFAPTATDLIPPGWHLKHVDVDVMGDANADKWACAAIDVDVWFHNDNPAEAAALAWLHVNRNQSNV